MTGDRGSATVFGAVAIAALVLVASLVLAVGAAEVTRHRHDRCRGPRGAGRGGCGERRR